ncbi:hypothetical protein H0X06_02035 [Candidatus Dependentiae bacterium]|nr:hypothetical protein [Candidatus Dependentiae bacterium]
MRCQEIRSEFPLESIYNRFSVLQQRGILLNVLVKIFARYVGDGVSYGDNFLEKEVILKGFFPINCFKACCTL